MRVKKTSLALSLALVLLFNGTVGAWGAPKIVYKHASRDGVKRIALTFDDGPHPRYTVEILDILAEFGISATFFVVGQNAVYHKELVERAAREGHEIGNHTHTHGHIVNLTEARFEKDIADCEAQLQKILGYKPTLMRPPEGVCNEIVKSVSERHGYTVVLWSIDTRDWAHTPVAEICANVQAHARDGSIVLMHDFIGQNSPTPAALRRIIPMLQEAGFLFVTVSQLLEA